MGRRVFLSVLGVAFYETCRYRKDDFTGSETLFVQKSLLEYLQQQENWGGENDLFLVLLTDLARKNNWDRNLKTRFCAKLQQEVAYQGLEKILLDMNLSYRDIAIPDGKDSDEMWEIFEVIFDELQEGDELYLDITNSFRYLPMLLVVLVNYAKLLKNVKVKAIFMAITRLVTRRAILRLSWICCHFLFCRTGRWLPRIICVMVRLRSFLSCLSLHLSLS